MEAKKNIGIWMDHSAANFIDLNANKETTEVPSEFTIHVKEESMNRNENVMNNKEQHMHHAYYKQIADEILNYDHVLLFGPTSAKTELHNQLKKDLHFKDIKIDIESADKMTNNEKISFVKKHFKL